MNIHSDDPRLSAYVLGELPPEEAAAVKHALAADPALRLSVREIEKMASFLDQVFAGEGSSRLLPVQREAVMRAGRSDGDKVIELASARTNRRWGVGLGAAAAVMILAVALDRIPVGRTGIAGDPGTAGELALMPLPGPGSGSGTSHAGGGGAEVRQAQELRERPREYLESVGRSMGGRPLPEAGKLPPTGPQRGFSPAGELRLPVVIGTASWSWVSGWIGGRNELPPRDAVRVEELINTASLPEPAVSDGLRVAVEAVATPWNPDSRLVAVEWSAGESAVEDLEIRTISGSPQRVLGSFRAGSGQDMPDILPAHRRTLVMIEVLNDVPDSPAQRIEIRAGGRETREVTVPETSPSPSAGMRHAVLMAGFGLWLRGEDVGAGTVARLAEEAGAVDSDPVRRAARRIVGEALALSDPGR